MSRLSGVTKLSKLVCLPSKKGSTLKGNTCNLLPLGHNLVKIVFASLLKRVLSLF